MFAFRKIIQEGITKVPLRNFSATSIYDIQDKVIQEKSPYTEKPSNVFDDTNNKNKNNNNEINKLNVNNNQTIIGQKEYNNNN